MEHLHEQDAVQVRLLSLSPLFILTNKTRYPAIIGILLAVLLALLALYCALRFLSCCCCDCLSGGRYRPRSKKRHGNRHRYADLANSPYSTAAYQQQQQQQAPMGTIVGSVGERPPR
ncbi:MAG: hypothetical protein Q9193_006956, partial [Seirophora villosa]